METVFDIVGSVCMDALHGLFTSLRAEVRGYGVHVMIVCPGFIRTHLQDRALGADGEVTRAAPDIHGAAVQERAF